MTQPEFIGQHLLKMIGSEVFVKRGNYHGLSCIFSSNYTLTVNLFYSWFGQRFILYIVTFLNIIYIRN